MPQTTPIYQPLVKVSDPTPYDNINLPPWLKKPEKNYLFIEHISNISFSNSADLTSFVYLPSVNKFIICDEKNSVLNMLNFSDSCVSLISHKKLQNDHLKKPTHLCAGKNDEIFVSEHSNGDRIFVFDSNLKYLRHCKIKPMFISKMKIDLTNHQNLLYISVVEDNKVSVLNSENFECKTDLEIMRPNYIEFDVNFIYITSYPSFKTNFKTGQIEALQKKCNCISVLQKNNYGIISVINFDNWFIPRGLYVGKNGYIYTRAAVLDQNRIQIGEFLYIMARDGTLIQKIEFKNCVNEIGRCLMITDEFIFYLKDGIFFTSYRAVSSKN